MAFQKSHTVKGFTFPESYWRVGYYQFNRQLGYGTFIMQCYANAAARQESLANVIDELPAYRIETSMTEAECYEHALNTATIVTGADENGEAVMVSFFADAVEV